MHSKNTQCHSNNDLHQASLFFGDSSFHFIQDTGRIDLITVLEAIWMGRQTRLVITVFVWKSNVK